MDAQILILTSEGVVDLGGAPLPGQPFAGRKASGGCAREREVAVIVDHREVWARSAGGWRLEAKGDHRVNTLLWTPRGGLLAGTEKGRMAWVERGGLSFIESFDEVPTRSEWFTPWGGPPDTHSLVRTGDGAIFAGVHVGWVMRSRDGGEGWEQVREGLHIDVHKIAPHPGEPSTLLAATAGGLCVSEDGGGRFSLRSVRRYQRGVACFPGRDVWLAAFSDGPGGGGVEMLRTEDRGGRWSRVEGLPRQERNINHIVVTGEGRALALLGRELYATGDFGGTWTHRAGPFPKLFADPYLHHICPVLAAGS